MVVPPNTGWRRADAGRRRTAAWGSAADGAIPVARATGRRPYRARRSSAPYLPSAPRVSAYEMLRNRQVTDRFRPGTWPIPACRTVPGPAEPPRPGRLGRAGQTLTPAGTGAWACSSDLTPGSYAGQLGQWGCPGSCGVLQGTPGGTVWLTARWLAETGAYAAAAERKVTAMSASGRAWRDWSFQNCGCRTGRTMFHGLLHSARRTTHPHESRVHQLCPAPDHRSHDHPLSACRLLNYRPQLAHHPSDRAGTVERLPLALALALE